MRASQHSLVAAKKSYSPKSVGDICSVQVHGKNIYAHLLMKSPKKECRLLRCVLPTIFVDIFNGDVLAPGVFTIVAQQFFA